MGKANSTINHRRQHTLYPMESKLAPYLSGNTAVFKCPGDPSENVRTYSMGQAVGIARLGCSNPV